MKVLRILLFNNWRKVQQTFLFSGSLVVLSWEMIKQQRTSWKAWLLIDPSARTGSKGKRML
jgi:hypothetical protein